MKTLKINNNPAFYSIMCFFILIILSVNPVVAQDDFKRYIASLPSKDGKQAEAPQHMILLTASEEADKVKEQAKKKKEEEAKKLEAEKKAKAEETRKLEEARKAALKKQQEEAKRKAAEAKKKAEEEAKRIAAEAKKQEELRKAAEEARKVEAARIAAEEKLKKEKAAKSKKAKKWIKTWGKKAKKSINKEGRLDRKKRMASISKDDAVPFHERFFDSAQYAKWKAIYVGGHIGTANVEGSGSVSVGGVVGRNWQENTFVYGVEGELAVLNNDETNSVSGGTLSVNSDWMASIRVRAGYLMSPDTLLYATAGVAWANFDTELSGISGSTSSSETMAGFVIGAGIEHHFTEDWAARLEYAYTDFGSRTIRNGTQVASLDPDIHAIKLAFVYRF